MSFLFTLPSTLKHAYPNHKISYVDNKNLLCRATEYIQIYSFYRIFVTQGLLYWYAVFTFSFLLFIGEGGIMNCCY